MNPAQIAQMAIILAPLAQDIIVEGGKVMATFNQTISDKDLARAIFLSKSTNWPELDFIPPAAEPSPEAGFAKAGLLMMRAALFLMAACGTLTGYNVKTTIGQTDYENGSRALYTGASVDAHFDVMK